MFPSGHPIYDDKKIDLLSKQCKCEEKNKSHFLYKKKKPQYELEGWKRKHYFTSWDLVNLLFYFIEEAKSMMTGSSQSQSISYVKDI